METNDAHMQQTMVYLAQAVMNQDKKAVDMIEDGTLTPKVNMLNTLAPPITKQEPLDKTLEVGTHDWPHGPQSRDQVIIGRLRKKIERLIKQRDYHKARHEH